MNTDLIVLVPVANTIEPECEASLSRLREKGIKVRVYRGASAIDQARNTMAADALRDGFTKLLWIDADIGFDPEDVELLLSSKEPLVCGIYPKRVGRALACHVLPGTTELVFGEEGGLVEILYAAGGFLLVDASVYQTIREKLALPTCNAHFGQPVVPYHLPMVKPLENGGAWYLAEDYAFCERARQVGFRIMADTRIRLRHIGRYAYQWEEAGMELKRHTTFRLVIRS